MLFGQSVTAVGATWVIQSSLYDHLADRWLLSQFANPNHMCIAISQTANPTAGTWFLYEFDTTAFPDYPKFGVWPDGYYMSTYEGANLGVYAFDRTNMLAGTAGTMLKTTITSLGAPGVRNTRILPSDLDGPAPAAGTPNVFIRSVDSAQDTGNPTDRIEVYTAVPDFVNSTFAFTLVDTLAPAAFDIMVCDRNPGTAEPFRDCIPQPDEVDTIDSLSNRPMAQLKFRQLAGVPTMVFNQTINVAGAMPIATTGEVAGIRWYELRNNGANWVIQQEGTYAPQAAGVAAEVDLLHRWMGSAAFDKQGNIAIGYSIVNSNSTNGQEVYPGMRYAGRFTGDPVGTLPQGENVIVNGTAAQGDGNATVVPQRWGDYSALSVDPVDDCTFWYTSHITNGVTRIASFRFDNCNEPPVARCRNVARVADAMCLATASAADVNDGSTDPDGEPITFSLAPPGPFSAGNNPVTLTVTDAAGQSSSCSAVVAVADVTPPAFTFVPGALTITQCTSANIGQATASDNCSVVVTNNAPAKFPLGTTTVTWTATDPAGNAVTATQQVTAILSDDASCCPTGTHIMIGNASSNQLVGTAGSDCILGRGGDDVIDGRNGNDFVSGGSGRDTIFAGNGNDRVYGNDGSDTINAAPGANFIDGGAGVDVCFVGATDTAISCNP